MGQWVLPLKTLPRSQQQVSENPGCSCISKGSKTGKVPSGDIDGIRKSTLDRGICRSCINDVCKNLNNQVWLLRLHSPEA